MVFPSFATPSCINHEGPQASLAHTSGVGVLAVLLTYGVNSLGELVHLYEKIAFRGLQNHRVD